jgi:hypothetical protein
MTASIRSHSARVITVLQSLVAVAGFVAAAAAGLAAVPLQTPFMVITGAFSGTFVGSGALGAPAAGPPDFGVA